jgi:hypothetical protein
MLFFYEAEFLLPEIEAALNFRISRVWTCSRFGRIVNLKFCSTSYFGGEAGKIRMLFFSRFGLAAAVELC